jgi:hypothetical protein
VDLIKSITIKCSECPEDYQIAFQNFERHSREGFKCKCENIPYYPYQKLFYLSDWLKKTWYYLPNNGVTPITKCTITYDFFCGLRAVDFTFRLKSKRQIYQAVFQGDSESVKAMRNDAIHVFIKDDLDYLDFYEYHDQGNRAWRAISDYIVLIKRWNRETFDIHREGGYKLIASAACEAPKKLGKH